MLYLPEALPLSLCRLAATEVHTSHANADVQRSYAIILFQCHIFSIKSDWNILISDYYATMVGGKGINMYHNTHYNPIVVSLWYV